MEYPFQKKLSLVINCLENKKKQSEKVMGTIKGIPYGMSNFEDVITQNR